MTSSRARHQAIVESLRQRYTTARQAGNADTLQALFREAVYLGIQPELLDVEVGARDDAACVVGS